jgi:hypothetical protein
MLLSRRAKTLCCVLRSRGQGTAMQKLRIEHVKLGLARRDRKWPLNDRQIPNPNVVRVAFGTGYHRVEGNRRASRNRRVSRSPTRNPHRHDSQLLHRCAGAVAARQMTDLARVRVRQRRAGRGDEVLRVQQRRVRGGVLEKVPQRATPRRRLWRSRRTPHSTRVGNCCGCQQQRRHRIGREGMGSPTLQA